MAFSSATKPGTRRTWFGACAVLLTSILMLTVSGAAMAQEKTDGAKAEPKKKPQSSWVKICDDHTNKATKEKKQICLVHHERRDGYTGALLVSAAIRRIEGQDKEHLLIMVPLGRFLPAGMRVQIDKDKPLDMKYTICLPNGCYAEMVASEELVTKFKKGKDMAVLTINAGGKAIGFPVPLNGFTKAYEGDPIDRKKYEEAQRKLLSFIRKRQAELRKKAAEKAQQEKKEEAPKKPQ